MKTVNFVMLPLMAAIAISFWVFGSEPAGAVDATVDQTVATTPAEHRTMADLYEKEALDLDQKSEKHKRMSQLHGRLANHPKNGSAHRSMARHCKNLAETFARAAREAHEMAKLHRGLAD
jgi:hypothetical protein